MQALILQMYLGQTVLHLSHMDFNFPLGRTYGMCMSWWAGLQEMVRFLVNTLIVIWTYSDTKCSDGVWMHTNLKLVMSQPHGRSLFIFSLAVLFRPLAKSVIGKICRIHSLAQRSVYNNFNLWNTYIVLTSLFLEYASLICLHMAIVFLSTDSEASL